MITNPKTKQKKSKFFAKSRLFFCGSIAIQMFLCLYNWSIDNKWSSAFLLRLNRNPNLFVSTTDRSIANEARLLRARKDRPEEEGGMTKTLTDLRLHKCSLSPRGRAHV
jgi:hypothetical protein